jgi:hypothetical protein
MIEVKMIKRYGMEIWLLTYATTNGNVARTFFSEASAKHAALEVLNAR